MTPSERVDLRIVLAALALPILAGIHHLIGGLIP